MTLRQLCLAAALVVVVMTPFSAGAKTGTNKATIKLVALVTASMQIRINIIHFRLTTPRATWTGMPAVKGLEATGVLWGKRVLNQHVGNCGSHYAMRITMRAPVKFTIDEAARVLPGHIAVYVRDVHGRKVTAWKRLAFNKKGARGPARYRYASIAAYSVLTEACVSPAWLAWDWISLPGVELSGVHLDHIRGYGSGGDTDLFVNPLDHFIYYEYRTSALGKSALAFYGFNNRLGVPLHIPPR